VRIDYGSTLAHQIWPLSVEGLGIAAPNLKKCPKLQFFVSGGQHNKRILTKFGTLAQTVGILFDNVFGPDW